MAKYPPPKVPFVEAQLIGEKQKPTAIVIDLSMTTSEKGAALGIANRLHARNAPATSFHYMVDEAMVYRGLWDDKAAYGCPYRAINVLVCAEPVEDSRLWGAPTHAPVLRKTSDVVADLILAYKIKPRYLFDEDKDRWLKRRSRRRGGVIVRVPGAWPVTHFMNQVFANIDLKTS